MIDVFTKTAALFLLLLTLDARAATEPTSRTQPAAGKSSPVKQKKASRVNFEDALVEGKYHFSEEMVTTVEEDKVIDALLSVRRDFNDRMTQAADRQ